MPWLTYPSMYGWKKNYVSKVYSTMTAKDKINSVILILCKCSSKTWGKQKNWNWNITLCANKNCDRFGSSAQRFCLRSSTFLHFWHEETKITRRGLKTGCSPTWFNCPHHLYTYATYVLHLHEQAGPRQKKKKKRWSHPHPSALLQCSSQRDIEINVPPGTETIKIKIKSKLFIFFPKWVWRG